MSEYKDDGGAFDDNYKLRPFWRYVLLIVLLFFIARWSFADTLTYQSQTLPGTSTTIDGPSTDSYPLSDSYIVTVTVSGPLAPNLNMAMVTPTSWTVVCQNCLAPLSSSPTNVGMMTATSGVFMFSTDSTGKITAWNFAINDSFMLNQNGQTLNQGNGMYNSSLSGDIAASLEWPANTEGKQANAGPAGLWTQSSLSNPPPAITVLARTCNGTWGLPNNNVPAGLTPNANGSGMNCRMPSQYLPSWYIKVTTDGGKTYEFVTLASLGLGN